jgi:osmotically-inducible protein OsmY
MRVCRAGAAAIMAGGLLTGCVAAVIGSAPQSGTASDTRARAPAAPDAALGSAVRARFGAEPGLRAAPIEVSASRGTVTLRGTVASAAVRRHAEQAARTVAGVSTVNNQLEVK